MPKNPQNNPVLVIDGMSLFMSVSGPMLHLTNGFHYSFFTQVSAAVRKFQPSGIVVAWEGGGYGQRLEHWEGYKSTRTPMGDTRREQREEVRQMLTHLGVDQMYATGYEADDLGAYLSNTLDNVILFSEDHDWLQLVKPGVAIYQKVFAYKRDGTRKSRKERKLITEKNFEELTGWTSPEHFLQSLMVLGDKDECPGLFGIGNRFLREWQNGIMKENDKKRRLDEFFAGSPEYHKFKALVDIRGIKELPEIRLVAGVFDAEQVKNLLEKWQFASILSKFPEWVGNYEDAVI